MNADTSAPLVPNEPAVAWDTIVAPKAAFAALRERPRWLLAFALTCVLGMAGSLLQAPAGARVAVGELQRRMATDPSMAGMTAAQQQALLGQAAAVQHYVWIFYPLVIILACVLTAVVFLIARAAGKGEASFAQLFALGAHVGIVNLGLASLYIGLIVTIKGAANFDATRDLLGTLPSLAWLAPGAGGKLYAFLASFSVFAIWASFLSMLGLEIVAGVARPVAIATAAILLLFAAGAATLATQ